MVLEGWSYIDVSCVLIIFNLLNYWKKERKDPIIDDLIGTSVCYTTALGLYEVSTYWTHGKYLIECKLIGDYEGYYIEVTYIDNNKIKKYNQNQKNKIMKKL